MFKKATNIIFSVAVFVLLAAGLARTLLAPVDISEYENRYAEKLGKPTPSNYLAGVFQDSVELALSDQLFYAQDAKRNYNEKIAAFKTAMLGKVIRKAQVEAKPSTDEAGPEDPAQELIIHELPEDGSYSEMKIAALRLSRARPSFDEKIYRLSGTILLCRDHLLYNPRVLENHTAALDRKADNINEYVTAYPDIDFYVYYVEKETDIDFSTMKRVGLSTYLWSRLDLPFDRKACFTITNFDDFDEWFFKTDHHWCYKGSYRAYKQVLRLLLPREVPLEPTGEYDIGIFSGSKTGGSDSATYNEMFRAYSFDLPELETWQNGAKTGSYGGQDHYIAQAEKTPGKITGINYGKFYGQDSGEIIIKNPASDNGNILILGESYDNAILRLLACHFSEIYSVDLRNYKAQRGKTFNFDDYVKEHGITRVLLIGNCDYFLMQEFLLR